MTLYLSNRDGNGRTSEEGHYRFQTQLWSGDIIPGSGDELIVTQNNPVGMQVLIGTGDFKIDTGFGYSYTGWNSNSLPVQVSTADPANPRISSIVLYVDKGEGTSPSPPNNPGIIKAASVNGTPSVLPTPPSLSTIQSQVGPSNPYIILANVRVNAGSNQIVNGNITDDRKFVSVLSDSIGSLSIEERMLGTNSVTGRKIHRTSTNTGFTPSANISSMSIQQLDCVGGMVHGVLVASTAIALTDTSYNVGVWNLSSVGVASTRGGRFAGYSDGGNSIGMFNMNAAGSVQSVDWKPNNLSVGATIELTIISPVVSYL